MELQSLSRTSQNILLSFWNVQTIDVPPQGRFEISGRCVSAAQKLGPPFPKDKLKWRLCGKICFDYFFYFKTEVGFYHHIKFSDIPTSRSNWRKLLKVLCCWWSVLVSLRLQVLRQVGSKQRLTATFKVGCCRLITFTPHTPQLLLT